MLLAPLAADLVRHLTEEVGVDVDRVRAALHELAGTLSLGARREGPTRTRRPR
jgi:hypothetical protein